MGNIVNRAAIVQAHFRQVREVEVPEWGGTVRLRAMSGNERDELEAESFTTTTETVDGKPVVVRHVNVRKMRARLLARCMIDEAGDRIFADDEIDILGAEDSGLVARLFAVAQDMNGLGMAAKETAEKNSNGPKDVSISG